MVPKAAREALGRTEFTKSLGVADRRRALDLSHAVLAQWKAVIDAAMSDVPLRYEPDARNIEAAAYEVGFERASKRADDLIRDKARLGPRSYDSLKAKIVERHGEALRLRQAGDDRVWIDRARRLVREANWMLDESNPAFASLVNNLATSGIDTLARAKAIMDGVDDQFLPSLFVQQVRHDKAMQAPKGETILALFEKYSAQRLAEGRQRKDTVDQGRKVITLFANYVGTSRALSSIKAVEVREWRNAVASLPPAFQKRKEYKGLPLREASDRAKSLSLDGLSPNTVNRYLSTLSPLLDWARQEGYLETNPCDGLFYDLKS